MKKILPIVFASMLIGFAACSEDAEGGDEGENTEEEANIHVEWNVPEGSTVAVADIDIKGMSCQMNCVNKVNTSLSELNGVASCDIDFDSDKEIDHATVTFDPSVVTEAELIQAVTGIADGAYSITNMEVNASQANSTASDSESEETVELNDNTMSGLALPNIIEIFYSLF